MEEKIYNDIADRFCWLIAEIQSQKDREQQTCGNRCSECGEVTKPDLRLLNVAVFTRDEEVFSFRHDGVSFAEMIRLLREFVQELRVFPEPILPCSDVGSQFLEICKR